MVWDWQYAWDVFPPDIAVNGLRITLVATVLGSLLAYALGLVLMLLRRSPIRLVRSVTWGIIEFVRSTPLFLVQIFFLFFVLPDFGVRFDPLTTGVIALGLHYATYTAEVYRAGIEAVPRGQWDAAVALNLPPRVRTWTAVILPQAVHACCPPSGTTRSPC